MNIYIAALRITHEGSARCMYLCALTIEEKIFLSWHYGCADRCVAFRRATVEIDGNIMPGAHCFVLGYGPHDNQDIPKGYRLMRFPVPSRITREV